eukprot:gnl/TRDRNA2_/TRDRNA2_44695_c0_seq1.p1 gnl/TRDRNA2_/TRDRNA2_44695_c0~~gnl/TRDRNA2_/TRDRNA2_44695_c0_seq1.p1  ORF type:complete len:196 (+),score=30.57 gnl/TRDRNA2_/TRDRNA2_44695_c0_seq1:52-639(+)
MLRGTAAAILLACVAWADAEDPIDELLSKVLDRFADRVLTEPSHQRSNLDDTTLGKRGQLAVPAQNVDLGGVTLGKSGPGLAQSRISFQPQLRAIAGRMMKAAGEQEVEYGANWYEQTRKAIAQQNSKEYMDRYRKANLEANKGREREDLYTDKWDGDVYKGSRVNILTVLIAFFVLTPVAGLIFANLTYGKLWG